MIGTTIEFEAGHRQLGDTGKCKNFHGHNWKVEIELDGRIDTIGYIIDFKELKNLVDEMDHAMILNKNDPFVQIFKNYDQKVYVMNDNPSCENISLEIVDRIINKFSHITYCKVRVYENEKSWGECLWI